MPTRYELLLGDLAVARARPAPGWNEAVATHEHDLARGEREELVDERALRHVAEAHPARAALVLDAPAKGRENAEHRAEYGGLARPVGADDPEELAVADGEARDSSSTT